MNATSAGRPSATARHLTSTSELTPARIPTDAIGVDELSARGPPWLGTRERTLGRNRTAVASVGKPSARLPPSSHTRKLTRVKKPIKSLTVGKLSIRAATSLHFRARLLSWIVLSAFYQIRAVRRCSADVLLEKKQTYATVMKKALQCRSEKGPFNGASCPMSFHLLEKMSK